MWDRHELPPEPGVDYTGFTDPGGGVSDSMTLGIAHLGRNNACILDAMFEKRAPFNPEEAVAECAVLCRCYGVTKIVGDKYAGEWPRARFAEHGIEFEQSARPKSDLYRDLLPLLNARRVELLDHPRLSAQLCALERRTARSGRDSIDHGPGGHDDLANAVAGVLVGVDLDRRQPLVRLSDVFAVGGQAPPLPGTAMLRTRSSSPRAPTSRWCTSHTTRTGRRSMFSMSWPSRCGRISASTR